MADREPPEDSEERLLGHNPLLDDDAVFSEVFSGGMDEPQPPPRSQRRPRDPNKKRPEHYRIVSFSLYLEDIARLDALVEQLKKRGYTKANKSQIIRYALATVDIDKMPTFL